MGNHYQVQTKRWISNTVTAECHKVLKKKGAKNLVFVSLKSRQSFLSRFSICHVWGSIICCYQLVFAVYRSKYHQASMTVSIISFKMNLLFK